MALFLQKEEVVSLKIERGVNMSEWIIGGGIPQSVKETLKEIGASQTEFMNMLNNGEGIPENLRDVNNNTTADIDMDTMSNVVLQKLRKKYQRF